MKLRDHQTEDEFKDAVVELAQRTGWLVMHTRPARTNKGWRTPLQGDRGFPDLVLVKRPRVIFAELKSQRGSLTIDERRWMDELYQVADESNGIVTAVVWRPSDWDAIADLLTYGRGVRIE